MWIWINTTSNSKITEIEPFGEVKDSTNLLQASSSKIELALVSVTQHKKCSNVKCNKSILPKGYLDCLGIVGNYGISRCFYPISSVG
jgi:hypothetical protein